MLGWNAATCAAKGASSASHPGRRKTGFSVEGAEVNALSEAPRSPRKRAAVVVTRPSPGRRSTWRILVSPSEGS